MQSNLLRTPSFKRWPSSTHISRCLLAGIGGSNTQVSFQQVTRCRSLFYLLESNPEPSIWLTFGLKTNLWPTVRQIKGLGDFPKGKTMTCNDWPVECDLCLIDPPFNNEFVTARPRGILNHSLKDNKKYKITSRLSDFN